MIWNNGGAMGYGRDARGWRKLPRFSYRRSVDYVSGACLAVRNDVLQVVRGGEYGVYVWSSSLVILSSFLMPSVACRLPTELTRKRTRLTTRTRTFRY